MTRPESTTSPCVGCETPTPHRCGLTHVAVCAACADWWAARLVRRPQPLPVAFDIDACIACGELTRLREPALNEPCCIDCQRRALDAAGDRAFGGAA